MREEEKALSGKLFWPGHPDLVSIKLPAHNLCQEYGMLPEEDPRRQEILRTLLKKMGENVRMQGPIFFNYGRHTSIGNNFFANYNFVVQDDAEVTIGDGFMAGPNVSIVTPSHPLPVEERKGLPGENGKTWAPCYAKPVHIGNHVWLAVGVVVCPGVTIGDNTVIAAGSVVTRDIPAGVLAGGTPCRVIREITPQDSVLHLLEE